MDIRGLDLPQGLGERNDLPKIFFFPAYHKEIPYTQFFEFSTEAIMRRLESEADIKFVLPENPHLSKADYDAIRGRQRAEDL